MRSILSVLMIGTDHGSSDGIGMPLVPYVAPIKATLTPLTSSPSRAQSASVRWIPSNPSSRLWLDAVEQASNPSHLRAGRICGGTEKTGYEEDGPPFGASGVFMWQIARSADRTTGRMSARIGR